LLIYECGSRWDTSGGPILKAVDGKFEAVGLHRGGFDARRNCGTIFSDILKNISGKAYNTRTFVNLTHKDTQ